MSVTAMARVWPVILPAPEKLVLLRLADFANDEGCNCFPSLGRLARECGHDERTVRRVLRRLEGRSLLHLVAEADAGRKRPREYRLDLGEMAKQGTGGRESPLKRKGRGADCPPTGGVAPSLGGAESPVTGGPRPPRTINDPPVISTIGENTHLDASASGERVASKPALRVVVSEGAKVPEEMTEHVADHVGAPIPPRVDQTTLTEPETPSPAKARAARGSKLHPAEVQAAFAEFWPIYPRRVAKGTAFKAYRKALAAGASPAEILIGCRRFAEKVARDGTEARFIPHPGTWLNATRWLDEPEPKSAPKFKDGWVAVMHEAAMEVAAESYDAGGIFDSAAALAHDGVTLDLEAETTTNGRAA